MVMVNGLVGMLSPPPPVVVNVGSRVSGYYGVKMVSRGLYYQYAVVVLVSFGFLVGGI
jgi:TRAP-type C4-dicarboxylate transport system permease large subunit